MDGTPSTLAVDAPLAAHRTSLGAGWLVPAHSSRIATVVSPLWIVIFGFPVMSLLVAVWTLMDRYYGSWADMQIALTALLLP